VIEIEGLTIQYAVEDCRFYLLSNKFTVFTDHRQLEGTFRKNLSEVINPKAFKLQTKISSGVVVVSRFIVRIPGGLQ
jgi:hypothetical protein